MCPITQSAPTDVVSFLGAVDDAAVLDRGPGSDPDAAELVAAEDGARPHRRLVAQLDVADDHGIGVDVRVGMDSRGEIAEGVDRHVSGPYPGTNGGGPTGPESADWPMYTGTTGVPNPRL